MSNTMFLTLFISGCIFLLIGSIMLKFPPKRINYWYGYRTPSSMKNQARWNFAQYSASKELLRIGGLMIALAITAFFFKLPENVAAFAGPAMVIMSAVILILRVEIRIKRKFNT